MLWGFSSLCAAPLRHLGLGSVLPQPLPGLSWGLSPPRDTPLGCGTRAGQVSRGEWGLLQAQQGFVPGKCEDNVALVCLLS